MNQKIRFLRETLGLTEKEISSFLNISSYKYITFEKTAIDIPCDILILLSRIYAINLELLLYSKYNNEDLFSELKRQEIFFEDKSVILETYFKTLIQKLHIVQLGRLKMIFNKTLLILSISLLRVAEWAW